MSGDYTCIYRGRIHIYMQATLSITIKIPLKSCRVPKFYNLPLEFSIPFIGLQKKYFSKFLEKGIASLLSSVHQNNEQFYEK